MKITKLGSMAVSMIAAQLLWIAPAQATLISDYKEINATLSQSSFSYNSATASPSTSFDLTDDGVPELATVNWAKITFSLLDSDGREDSVYAFFGGDMLMGHSDPYGFSVFGGLVSGDVVTFLNSSGILDYTLTFVGGKYSSVLVKGGSLVADVSSVPEPATLSLLGAGLLASWLGARRRTRKQ